MSTRPPAMSMEEVQKLVERLINGGARITMADPRVSSAQTWFLGAIGMTLIGVGTWGIKSINELNQTMTVVVTQNQYRDAQAAKVEKKNEEQDDRADRIERHLESVDARIVILERKVK